MSAANSLVVGSERSRWIVPIGGGLGAQIFGVLLVEFLRKRFAPEKVFPDSSYFLQQPRRASSGEGVSIFRWEMDYYDLPRQRYAGNPPKAPTRLVRRLGLSRLVYLEDGSVPRQRLVREALTSGIDWNALFPIALEDRVKAERILNSGDASTAVVHLRRGDYLNVASHVVSDEAVIPVMSKLNRLGVRRFVLLSDGDIRLEFFKDYLERGTDLSIFPRDDTLGAHALMRVAKWLITSNSQFSLSAALLNQSGLCLTPRVWYSGKSAALHAELAGLSEWSMIGWSN